MLASGCKGEGHLSAATVNVDRESFGPNSPYFGPSPVVTKAVAKDDSSTAFLTMGHGMSF